MVSAIHLKMTLILNTYPLFHDLRVSNLRIRHVYMATTVSMPRRTGTTTAGNRFAVAVTRNKLLCLFVPTSNAEGKNIHATVARSAGPERFENDIGNALGCERVASTDGGVTRRIEDGTLGYDNSDRFDAT